MANEVQYKFLDIDGVNVLKEELETIITESEQNAKDHMDDLADELNARLDNTLSFTEQTLTKEQQDQAKINLGIFESENEFSVTIKTWTSADMV